MIFSTSRSKVFQTLWIGPRLSTLERLSLTSFLANGHRVHFYSYGPVEGIPTGVKQCDARAIVPEDRIFRYPAGGFGAGSVAGFANLFRYKLLFDRGGWWFDTDVVCLRHVDITEPYCFAREDDTGVNNALMRAPRGSPLMKTLYERALASGTDLKFGTTGPTLLTACVAGTEFERYVLPREAVYPLHYGEASMAFADDPHDVYWNQLAGAYTVHLWNELLKHEGIDKSATFPATSMFTRLCHRYGVTAVPNGSVRDEP